MAIPWALRAAITPDLLVHGWQVQPGMLIRGAIQDRLWGKTLGALCRRAVTGQLEIRSGSDSYKIVFDGGHVVAASAPGSATTLLGVAFGQELLDVTQVAELEMLPLEDREAALANVLPAEQVLRLRRQAIAGAATRTFALLEGDFEFIAEVTLPVVPGTAMHVGGLIYHGVLAHLDDDRLASILQELGTSFRSIAEGIPDLPYFGFGESELGVVRALVDGISLAQLAHLPATERRIASAIVYTLASLGALSCEAASTPPRVARGTKDPTPPGPAIARTRSGGIHPRSSAPSIPPAGTPQSFVPRNPAAAADDGPVARTPTPPAFAPRASSSLSIPPRQEPAEDAATLYKKGQAALRDSRLEDAVLALTRASELAPEDLEVKAALAWARFCAAANKPAAADAARQILGQVAHKHERPVLAHYYLGMVERIIGRNAAALAHFHEVLELDPAHREASTELRFLSRSSGPIKR